MSDKFLKKKKKFKNHFSLDTVWHKCVSFSSKNRNIKIFSGHYFIRYKFHVLCLSVKRKLAVQVFTTLNAETR